MLKLGSAATVMKSCIPVPLRLNSSPVARLTCLFLAVQQAMHSFCTSFPPRAACSDSSTVLSVCPFVWYCCCCYCSVLFPNTLTPYHANTCSNVYTWWAPPLSSTWPGPHHTVLWISILSSSGAVACITSAVGLWRCGPVCPGSCCPSKGRPGE